ncbi:MAG: 4Fe-4S binding protein [Chloroflexi bacterium]|nr:4Fe-4S binding protein [Chloroflexota bacterium]
METGCIVTEAGSAAQYPTGGWRSQKPEYDNSKCNKCGLCYIYCPDCSITQQPDGFYKVDMFYCKGCGICAKECPRDVITMVPEAG